MDGAEQWRIEFAAVGVGFGGQQYFHCFRAMIHRQTQGGAVGIVNVRIGSGGEHLLNDFDLPLLGGKKERGLALIIGGVDVGVIGQQHLGHGEKAMGCGQMQRGIALRAFEVNIRAVIQEKLGHGFIAGGDGGHQGRHG